MPPPVVRLLALPDAALAALADGDLAAARAASGLTLPAVFLEQPSLWSLRRDQVRTTPVDAAWVVRAVVADDGTVVGHSGFHAAPDADGVVEVGYRINPEHRGRGYARAALAAQLARARSDPSVHRVRASVSLDNAASLHLARTSGFSDVREQVHPVHGPEVVLEVDVTTT